MDRGRASTTYSTPSSDAYEGGRRVAEVPGLLLLLLFSFPIAEVSPALEVGAEEPAEVADCEADVEEVSLRIQ